MRSALKLLMLFVSVGYTAVALSQPASATDRSHAEDMCKKNPRCTNDGMGFLKVIGSDGKNTTIYCPAKGSCYVLRTAGGASVRANGVSTTLSSVPSGATLDPKHPAGSDLRGKSATVSSQGLLTSRTQLNTTDALNATNSGGALKASSTGLGGSRTVTSGKLR